MRWIRSRASDVRGRGRSGPDSRGESGSEVVSHVLVQFLVLVVVLALLQLGFALHTRNMAIAAASEGARRGALLEAVESDAIARTDELLTAFAGSHDREITTERRAIGGREVLVVTVTMELPVVARFGPRWLTVSGSSIVEGEA